jgi:hypothetical protein
MRAFRSSLLLLVLFTLTAQGRVHTPRVLSPHTADAYSMKTFAEFDRWRDLEEDEKVYEIFKYLADRRTGLYPLGVPAWEGNEELHEYGSVTDPVKMINVYPLGFCAALGPTMAGIMEGMGVGPARTLIIPGWHHVASEVFYGGDWHYLDLDVRAVFRREDGSLASMADAQRDRSLWEQPANPLFFPLDDVAKVRDVYAKSAVQYRHGVSTGGHTMDYVLRQGETFTRWWKPQGGRWNHHPSYAAKPFPRNVIEREPRGPKSKHPSFTVHTHGNGRFVYQPNLTAASSDFDDGAYDSKNVLPGVAGLSLKEPGVGYAIFEVRSPYVIAPLVGDLDTAADDREASVVKVEGKGATLALSLDNGLSWLALGEDGSFDLTSHVSGRYGYLLKIELRGRPADAVVRALEITTWVQVHPASLPSLRPGKNIMRLVTGDHYGLPSRVVEVRPDAGNRDEFLRSVAEPPNDYDPARRTSRIRGPFMASVQAPPGAKIAWFSAGASFTTRVPPAQYGTRNSISYAVAAPENFRELYAGEIPADQSHWYYNVDREVRLEEPARELFVRYVGDPAVNRIRIYAHCLDDRPRKSSPLVVRQVWRENGAMKSKQVRLDGPGEFEIEAGPDPVDELIELSIPSR